MYLDRQADLSDWLPLAACATRAADAVGRKARGLARAGLDGLRTPGGHVLPADAFRTMLETHGVAERTRYLAAAALALDPVHAHAIAGDIATALAAPSVEAIAARHAAALRIDGAIVCRSSAAMEDGVDAAFPGMFASVLDIASTAALARAIAACWRSVFAPDLIRYLLRVRPARVDFSLALLVQPQVEAAWYGICFAADPIGARGMVAQLTDAAPDALVGGAPARLSFALEDGAWRGEGQPPPGLDQLPAAMARLTRLADRPVDVEFALADGDLVILQARPLTVSTRAIVRPEPPGVRDRIVGQPCAGGCVAGVGGGDVALVEAVTTGDYARVLAARAVVAAAETSPLGHVAILCRELGAPLVAGVGAAALARLRGAPLLVDGDAGRVLLMTDHPTATPPPEAGESEAVLGIDELAIRLLVARQGDPIGSVRTAILRDRRRLLDATGVRVIGSAPAPELRRRLDDRYPDPARDRAPLIPCAPVNGAAGGAEPAAAGSDRRGSPAPHCAPARR